MIEYSSRPPKKNFAVKEHILYLTVDSLDCERRLSACSNARLADALFEDPRLCDNDNKEGHCFICFYAHLFLKIQRYNTMGKDVPMYVRIKRQNQTYFVMCTPGDTIGYLKEQVALATKEEYKAGQMRMILPKDNTVLEDEDKLEKHEGEITNETELHVVFQISEGEWESVYIEDTQAAIGGDAP